MTEYKLRFPQKTVVTVTQAGMTMSLPRSINLHRLLDYYDAEDGVFEIRFTSQDDRDGGCGGTPFYSVLKNSVPYGTKVELSQLISFLGMPNGKAIRPVIRTATTNARRANERLFCEDGYVWLMHKDDVEEERVAREREHYTLDDVSDFT